MLLKIENLRVNYGAICALQGVSLEIDAGEIVTLIGANGAGKTTLLRTISGLNRSCGGAIHLAPNIPLERLPAHEIVAHGVSQVPEGRQIFPQMTVRENLSLGAYQRKNRSEIRGDLDHIYELFPILSERRQQKAGTLSGGEQQMLAIGRALMARPKLLLLDEPSLGLAPLIVRKIFEIIRQINQNGTTIFLVEQNAHMALTIASRAYVLQTGQIIQTGRASDLLNDPQVKAAYLGG